MPKVTNPALAEDTSEYVRDDAKTLEIQLPKPAPTKAGAPAPQAPEPDPAQGPKRSLSPAQPLRKVSMGVWGRTQESPAAQGSPTSNLKTKPDSKTKRPSDPPVAPIIQEEPTTPSRDHAVAAAAAAAKAAEAPSPIVATLPTPNLAALGITASPSGGLPVPGLPTPVDTTPTSSPARGSVASMFSWVTQRTDWAPPAEPLEPPPATPASPILPSLGASSVGAPVIPPPIGVSPLAISSTPIIPPLVVEPVVPPLVEPPAPPVVPAPVVPAPVPMPAQPPSVAKKPAATPVEPTPPTESVVAEEPIALNSEETLVLIHFDASVPLDALAERTGLSEFRLKHHIVNLTKRGVLDDPNAPPAPPAPPAPAPPALVKSGPSTPTPELKPPTSTPAQPRLAPPPVVAAAASTKLAPPTPSAPSLPDSTLTPPTERGTPQFEEIDSQPTLLEIDLAALAAAEREHARAGAAAAEDEPDFAVLVDRPFSKTVEEKAPFGPPSSRRPATQPTQQQPTTQPSMQAPHAKVAEFAALDELAPDTETTIVDSGTAHAAEAARDRTAAHVGARTEDAAASVAPTTAPSATDEGEGFVDDEPGESEDVGEGAHDPRNYLAHFEKVLAPLPTDQRAKLASVATGIDLYALVYDKEPDVARALWQNINISHEHARFAAFHHRTTVGLDLIAQNGEYLRDSVVQRRIVRNPVVSEQLLRRLLLPKRLIDIYKVTLDREAAERTRASARSFLRNKFATTDPEDRLELIWKTEGRALTALSGLSLDSKTAALICGRQIMSIMLVQSFTRFAATPPSVIAHFLKQPLVKRQVHLRNALLKHPNCPSDAKRAF
ncbi:MAG: hypothetical protein U0271_32460 [Polyangiaceae bacterium]